MKVGQYVKCVRQLGGAFTVGEYYEILAIRKTNGACLLRSNSGLEMWMFVGPQSQLIFIGDLTTKMPEPMFDLEDMELAEILMEEMKNA